MHLRPRSLARGLLGGLLCVLALSAPARDLAGVIEAGELRHLGIPYANFVTGRDDGLDVEIMRGFAAELGVRYVFVASDWSTMFGDLTGRHARRGSQGAEWLDPAPIRGDVIANGVTVLPWRREVVAFSEPTFPSAVWLVARADSGISPIRPSGSQSTDISLVKRAIDGVTVLAQKNTCLDPTLYRLEQTRAEVRLAGHNVSPDEMAPAILHQRAETTLLDVPDALNALERWPGQLKVIGPISGEQRMAAAFRKDSPRLREAFNRYLAKIREDGSYARLVDKYYPHASVYFAAFFAE